MGEVEMITKGGGGEGGNAPWGYFGAGNAYRLVPSRLSWAATSQVSAASVRT